MSVQIQTKQLLDQMIYICRIKEKCLKQLLFIYGMTIYGLPVKKETNTNPNETYSQHKYDLHVEKKYRNYLNETFSQQYKHKYNDLNKKCKILFRKTISMALERYNKDNELNNKDIIDQKRIPDNQVIEYVKKLSKDQKHSIMIFIEQGIYYYTKKKNFYILLSNQHKERHDSIRLEGYKLSISIGNAIKDTFYYIYHKHKFEKEIIIPDNVFSELKEIEPNIKINTLFISGFTSVTLPKRFGSQISAFGIFECKEVTIPEKFLYYQHGIEYFKIRDSNIGSLPSDFGDHKSFNSIQKVEIKGTDIKELPQNFAKNMSNLKKIDISRNPNLVTELNLQMFENCSFVKNENKREGIDDRYEGIYIDKSDNYNINNNVSSYIMRMTSDPDPDYWEEMDDWF